MTQISRIFPVSITGDYSESDENSEYYVCYWKDGDIYILGEHESGDEYYSTACYWLNNVRYDLPKMVWMNLFLILSIY